MSRFPITLAVVLLAGVGCSKSAPPPAPAPSEATPPKTETRPASADPFAQETNALTMNEINLYMHRSSQMEGVAQKPQFWVKAGAFTMQGKDSYAFRDARAVIYSKQEDREEVVIDAKRGTFEQDRRAVLEDDVRVKAGTMDLSLSDITWEKTQEEGGGIARSDHPVKVNDPMIQLDAQSVRLYPESKEFELTAVTGTVRFGKESS